MFHVLQPGMETGLLGAGVGGEVGCGVVRARGQGRPRYYDHKKWETKAGEG